MESAPKGPMAENMAGRDALLEHRVHRATIRGGARIDFDHRDDPVAFAVTLEAMPSFLQRWFGGGRRAAESDEAADVREWAGAQGHRFAPGRGGDGFVIEPRGGAAWRVEWGPSQRDYIEGGELRVRAEIGAAGDLQMLLVTRSLAARLEAQVFDRFTEGNQTRIDDRTPEEMRWLVLYPQVPLSVLGALHDRFAALANRPAAAPMWLEGALARRLEACAEWLDAATPLALIVQRGRFVLRMAHAVPAVTVVASAIGLASVAAAAARRVGTEVVRGALGSERPSRWGASSAMPPQAEA